MHHLNQWDWHHWDNLQTFRKVTIWWLHPCCWDKRAIYVWVPTCSSFTEDPMSMNFMRISSHTIHLQRALPCGSFLVPWNLTRCILENTEFFFDESLTCISGQSTCTFYNSHIVWHLCVDIVLPLIPLQILAKKCCTKIVWQLYIWSSSNQEASLKHYWSCPLDWV